MKNVTRFFRHIGWAWILIAVALGVRAQLPPNITVSQSITANPQIPIYRETPRGQIMDAMITFKSAASTGRADMHVTQFDMRTFKEGDTNQIQLRALAPQCDMNVNTKVAADPGPLELFTPTTNLHIQGVGFYCDQTRRLLILSNQVETRIAKGLLKAPMFSGAASNESGSQMIRILADYCKFDSASNIIDYIGHVRVFDPQGDSVSRAMTIYLTTNNAIRAILETGDVAINVANRGVANAESAFYAVTNGAEEMRLDGEGVWRNGAEEARAGHFVYDSANRVLRATNHVRVRWPNPTNGPTCALLYSDAADVQWPPTNGPIESMTADGNVIIVNQSDQSRATGRRAVFNRAADSFQLTGSPDWWNDQMEVRGDLLSVGLSNRIYRADGAAFFKTRDASSTNRSIQISCESLVYQTNLAEFHDRVVARSFEKDALQDTLISQMLTVTLVGNKIQTAIATGDVRGETVADAAGARKKLRCETLTAWRSISTGFMEKIVGETNVVLEQFGATTNLYDSLKAEVVTAFFAPDTNRVDRAVAERNVQLEQRKPGQTIDAASEHAVYTSGTNALLTLTGSPSGHTDKYTIAGADSLVWQPQGGAFRAIGRYKIIPISPKN